MLVFPGWRIRVVLMQGHRKKILFGLKIEGAEMALTDRRVATIK